MGGKFHAGLAEPAEGTRGQLDASRFSSAASASLREIFPLSTACGHPRSNPHGRRRGSSGYFELRLYKHAAQIESEEVTAGLIEMPCSFPVARGFAPAR
jgi:hypothetical protein